MNDKTKKYLDKVIEFMVEDTIVDNEKEMVIFPFYEQQAHIWLVMDFRRPPLPFIEYCKDMWGLTKNEIEYVWEPYRNIIQNKKDSRFRP